MPAQLLADLCSFFYSKLDFVGIYQWANTRFLGVTLSFIHLSFLPFFIQQMFTEYILLAR